MAFTKITNAELNSRGATTLPNVPTIGATALKQEFDAPAKNVVAPKFNNLIDELQASTASAELGAVAPTGRTGTTVQGVLNSLSTDLGDVEASSHSHPNKTVIDKFADDGTGLTYDGSPISGAVESVNGKTGAVELDASDVGALPDDTVIPTKTSDLTNDSNFITDASYVHTDNNYDATAKGIVDGVTSALGNKVDKVVGKGLSTNDYDNTAKAIVDGATAAIAAKSTVSWNQQITTGQRIAVVIINGTATDVYAPTSGGGGGGAVDSVNGYTGTVVLTAADVGALPSTTSIPTKVSDLTNDSGYQTASDVSTAIAGKADSSSLSAVATSGAYSDLTGTPSEATTSASGLMSASDKQKLNGIATGAEVNVQSDWNQSNSSADDFIKNKPTIPAAANNGTLTITQNGATKGTFTADQSTNASANIVTDEWSTSAQVSSGSVSFTIPSNTFGYDLYCERPNVSVTNVAVNGTTVTYTLSGAQNGDNCKLRILK